MTIEHVETLIIGGGQAGLTMSHRLSQRGRPHLVVERHRIAERWRTERWDGLRFQFPNWSVRLPDFPFRHDEADGFTTSAAIVGFITAYAAHIAAPVRCGVEVTALRDGGATGFIAETAQGPITAGNVVVATGPYQRAVVPDLAIGDGVFQVHASRYRDPAQLPDGGVLVVGSGASGSQIAEELLRAGRRVYLCVGEHRRMPRRYRGHDLIRWLELMRLDQTPVEKRGPSAALPLITGAYGGHTIDLRRFAADGVTLLGRLITARGGVLHFADDLAHSLAQGDAAYAGFLDLVDDYVARERIDAPPEPEARTRLPDPACVSIPIRSLDLRANDVGTVLWSTGYGFDFGWLHLPVLNERGEPRHRQGVTDVPGLYFLGLQWLSKMSSSFLSGVGDDAARLADHIAARVLAVQTSLGLGQDRAMTLPAGISFTADNHVVLPARFNVAVPFVDRHIDEGRGAKVAIRTLAEDVTYAQLAERANRAGNALLALGLKPGDRMLMVVKDCPAFFYLFWGAIKAGIVPVPPNTLLRASDYAYMFEDSGCGLVVYSREFAGEIEPALNQVSVKALTVDAFGEKMSAVSEKLEARLAAPTDDCFWLYSSGSTGRPKGAVHLQRDMVVTSELYGVRVLGVRESDVSFSAAKLFFAYGLGNGMTFPLWTGGTAILDDRRPTPDTTFEIIERFKPTLYYGVPTLYAPQLVALEKQKRDFSGVRACVSAGEALPPEIFRRWKEKTGTVILDGIGSTEALHIFIANSLADHRPGTSGRPVPGYEVRILDEHGKPVPQGESGRLWIRAESAAKYYWNKPDKTAETMVDGWLNTGDTYRQDADGYFIYDGRSDDMLKVGGIWCSPVEIENCLIGHDAVLEAAIVGMADENELVKPKAYVVLKPGQDAGEALTAELMSLCRSTLAPYKYPRWVEYVAELPKTATGKIQRFKLRA